MAINYHITAETLNSFRTPRQSLGDLDADIASTVIAMAADVALVVDAEGVVRDLAYGADDITDHDVPKDDFAGWVGMAWIDTVTLESRPKIEEMLADAAENGATRWRQVNHPSPRGIDLPVRYAALRMGDDGRVLVLGRELSTMAALQQRLVESQLSMEREYARLRNAETRYRQLFHIATEAVLIVNAATRKVLEANPAAGQLFEAEPKRLVGRVVTDLVATAGVEDLMTMLAAVRSTGRPEETRAELRAGGGAAVFTTSLFRQGGEAHYLMRVSAEGSAGAMAAKSDRAAFHAAVERLPEGFVVTDTDQRIVSANAAFLDLAELATEEQVRDQPIDRWLGRPGVDVNVLIANLKEHGSLRQFATILNGEYGSLDEVEVAAVALTDGDEPRYAFSVRSIGRRMRGMGAGGQQLPGNMSQLTELVGRVSLKELVRDTTDVIERMCIETALRLTGDNRASAAEMLGLSRQSLYSKLRRYGLGDLDGDSGRDD